MTTQQSFFASLSGRLVVYRNQDKIDLAVTEIWGKLITQTTEKSGTSRKTAAEGEASIGPFAHLLGLKVGAKARREWSKDSVREQLSTVTYDQKLDAVLDYMDKAEGIRCIDAMDGFVLEKPRGENLPQEQWLGKKWQSEEPPFVGYLAGVFTAERVTPVHDASADPASDVMTRASSLWRFRTVPTSAVGAIIPWIPAHWSYGSQSGIIWPGYVLENWSRIDGPRPSPTRRHRRPLRSDRNLSGVVGRRTAPLTWTDESMSITLWHGRVGGDAQAAASVR